MGNSRIPALKVSEDGVILNLNELIEVIKNTDVNSLTEEEFKEFENLYQTLANDNNSKNLYTNEEELVDELAAFNMKYKVNNEQQKVTAEELLQTIKGNKDDASNLDIVNTKGIENDSGKDISYLTAIVDGKRDVIQITNDDVLKKYLAENADSLNRMSSEDLFKNIKQHVFKNLSYKDINANAEPVNETPTSQDNYLEEMEAREVSNMINKFNYNPNYRVGTDENGERLYIVNNDIYKFKTSSDGKRTIYPIVKTTTSVEYTSEFNPELSEDELKEQAQNELNDIEKRKKNALDKEELKVKSSFETRPVDHSYTYNNQEYLDINKKLYDGKQMDPETVVEPNFANLSQDELNLFYYDTNELVKKLPDIFEKNIQSENINQAVSYATNMCKYIDQKAAYDMNPNEEEILRSYREAMDKIEKTLNERAVTDEPAPEAITDTYTDDVDVMITNRDAEIKEAEAQAEAKKIEAEIAEKLNPSEEVKAEDALDAKVKVDEENKEEIPEEMNAGYTDEDEFVNEESESPEYDEAAYAHPLPGQNHKSRRLGYPNQGEGTHGVALVLILLEIVAISILAVVFYNMMY